MNFQRSTKRFFLAGVPKAKKIFHVKKSELNCLSSKFIFFWLEQWLPLKMYFREMSQPEGWMKVDPASFLRKPPWRWFSELCASFAYPELWENAKEQRFGRVPWRLQFNTCVSKWWELCDAGACWWELVVGPNGVRNVNAFLNCFFAAHF